MTGTDDRPRLRLLDWERNSKGGALLGRAKIRLPSGLEISDVGVFEKSGRVWCQLPAEPLRDYATGELLKDGIGKVRYKSSLRWATRELQDGFSAAVVAAVEAQHGSLVQRVAA